MQLTKPVFAVLSCWPLTLSTLTFLPLTLLATPAGAGDAYVRVGAAYEESDDATVLDVDCASTSPPALFGCVDDAEDRPLAARGDFGSGVAWEVAGGIEIGRRARFELSLADRSFLDLDAEANFTGVSGEQPVRSDGRSRAALLGFAVDLGDPAWRWRPFVAIGAGVAWNETGAITYGFPGIDPAAVTVVRGGRHSDFAWSASLGVSFRWTESTFVELAVRYADLGELRTDDGAATIVRPSRTFELDIAGTRADLSTSGVFVSVRHRFGSGR